MDHTSVASAPPSVGDSSSPPVFANTTADPTQLGWASSLDSQEISRISGGLLVGVMIMAFSAPPAAVIWRTGSLHRTSYYYVLALCLLDCLLGAVTFAMLSTATLLAVLTGGIPRWTCTVFEAAINGCMHAVSVVMLALGRDRYLSLEHALSYPLLATTAGVLRHLKMAAAYGVVHGAILIGARAYNADLQQVQKYCGSLDWLLRPEYQIVAIVTVFNNIFLDIGTIIYNARVMYCAWKLRGNRAHALENESEEAQLSQNMKIFIFTFKLACLFLVCSLPYKLAILLHGLGVHSPMSLIRALGMIRMLYYILDGWTFCANEELLDAVKVMFEGCRQRVSELSGTLRYPTCRGSAEAAQH